MPDGVGRPGNGGITVLDGASFVAAAAIASVHVRDVIRPEPMGAGWTIVVGTFCWITVTAAGPFLFLVRRFVRRLPGYPGVGDWLWALLGLPWLLTALTPVPNVPGPLPLGKEIHSLFLGVGLAVVSLVAAAVVWATWVMVPPHRASETFSGPWTNRVGLCLAIAWPIQCGVGLVVVG
jgi:hypothetical protein